MKTGRQRTRRLHASFNGLYRHRNDLHLFLSAVGWLFLAWLALDLLPFQLYKKMLHPRLHSHAHTDDSARMLCSRIAWAVQAASVRVPWRTVCFHQGLAAHQMLCRNGIPSVLHYGVAKSSEGQKLDAHVWITVNSATIVGASTMERFVELTTFSGV